MTKQFNGDPVPPNEDPNDTIIVWRIEPHPYNSGYDAMICRDLDTAIDAANEAISHVFDNIEIPNETNKDVSNVVTIGLKLMRLKDFMELLEETE